MPLPAFRAEQETVELYRCGEVQHDTCVVTLAVMPGANRFYNGTVQRQLTEVAGQPRTADVDDQAVGGCQGESLVLHRAAQVEDQPQLVVGTPKAGVTNLRGIGTQRQRQGRAGKQHVEQHLASVHGTSQRAN